MVPVKKNAVLSTSFLYALTLLAGAAYAPKALADEVWTTQEYDVVYEEDRGRTAVWSYGEDGTLFIDGLADVSTGRGSYTGYWTQPTSSMRCDTFREDVNGEPTYHWGRFEITFIDPDFPSRWYADFGLCDGEPFIHLDGEPVTAIDSESTDSAFRSVPLD